MTHLGKMGFSNDNPAGQNCLNVKINVRLGLYVESNIFLHYTIEKKKILKKDRPIEKDRPATMHGKPDKTIGTDLYP